MQTWTVFVKMMNDDTISFACKLNLLRFPDIKFFKPSLLNFCQNHCLLYIYNDKTTVIKLIMLNGLPIHNNNNMSW